jgi:hypothetical protein
MPATMRNLDPNSVIHFSFLQTNAGNTPAYKTKRLYFFGQTDYIDAFKQKRWTRFCYSLPGLHEFMPLAQAGDWQAIVNRMNMRGFAFTFEIANRRRGAFGVDGRRRGAGAVPSYYRHQNGLHEYRSVAPSRWDRHRFHRSGTRGRMGLGGPGNVSE